MTSLQFAYKEVVASHHLQVSPRPLKPDQKKSFKHDKDNPLDDNLIIHGDNLDALKALLPKYGGMVNCIYIDPPYNTGNEGWVYNYNVNSPAIKQWLRKTVDSEDLERHDKWCCMMWPRLQLLKELLADDGVIFVSIDDNEQHRLRMIMDEIFGDSNFIAQLVWKKKYTGGKHSGHFVDLHEYVLVYGNRKEVDKFMIERPESEGRKFTKKDENFSELGRYYDRPFKSNLDSRKTLVYPITLPDGKTVTMQWIAGQEKFEEWKKGGKVFFKKLKTGKYAVYVKYYEKEGKGQVMFPTIIDEASDIVLDDLKKQYGVKIRRIVTEIRGKATDSQVDLFLKTMFVNPSVMEGIYNNDATTELGDIFGIKGTREIKFIFPTPKPSEFVKRLIRTATSKDAIVLDSFAGSGTTAHVVLDLNKQDGGNRKFILVECEDKYVDTVTTERVRCVIKGIPESKSKLLQEGTGGSFTYCTLGNPLDVEEMLTGKSLPDYPTLASHLLYVAAGTATTKPLSPRRDWLFWSSKDTDYYLKYKPDIKYLQSAESTLTATAANNICAKKRHAVVFAADKEMSQRELSKLNIDFCRLPDTISGGSV